jgi:hypothetical protein
MTLAIAWSKREWTSELHNGRNWILRNEDRAFFQLAIGDVYRLPGEDLPFSYQE